MFSCAFCKIFKNTFFTEQLWITASVIKTMECGILTIKEAFVKTVQTRLYSVFLNVPIKHVQKKEKGMGISLLKEEHSSISTSVQLWNSDD